MTITKEELTRKIKTKYPIYKDIPDEELYRKVIKKYPSYEKQVSNKGAAWVEGGTLYKRGSPTKQAGPSGFDPTYKPGVFGGGGLYNPKRVFDRETGKLTDKYFGERYEQLSPMTGRTERMSPQQVNDYIMGLDPQFRETETNRLREERITKMPLAAFESGITAAEVPLRIMAPPQLGPLVTAPFEGLRGAAREALTKKTSSLTDILGAGLEKSAKAGATDLAFTYGMMEGPRLLRKLGSKFFEGEELSPEMVAKIFRDQKKYTKRPLTSNQALFKYDEISGEVAKNVDDVVKFNVANLEDAVASLPEYSKKTVNIQPLLNSIDDAVNQADDLGITAFTKAQKKHLNILKKDLLSKGRYLSEEGTLISFKDAHEMKKNIYKVMAKAYERPDYTDDVANLYKKTAQGLNKQLRESTPYANANDKLKVIYSLYDDMGREGAKEFTGVGGAKYFKSLSKDPGGRRFLTEIEKVIPKEKQFMTKLVDFEETQAIRKTLQSKKLLSGWGPAVGATGGAAVGAATLGPWVGAPLGVAGGGKLGAYLSSGRGLARTARATDFLNKTIRPPLTLAGTALTRGGTPAIQAGIDVKNALLNALER